MTYVWTPPKRWDNGEPYSPSKFNTYFSDNLNYLFNPVVQGIVDRGNGSDTTIGTGAAAWVAIDDAQFSFYAATAGERGGLITINVTIQDGVVGGFSGLDVLVDDSTWLSNYSGSGNPGLFKHKNPLLNGAYTISLRVPVKASLLTAGVHRFSLRSFLDPSTSHNHLRSGYYFAFFLEENAVLTE